MESTLSLRADSKSLDVAFYHSHLLYSQRMCTYSDSVTIAAAAQALCEPQGRATDLGSLRMLSIHDKIARLPASLADTFESNTIDSLVGLYLRQYD